MDPHAFLNPKSIELLGLRIKLMMKSREMKKKKTTLKKPTKHIKRVEKFESACMSFKACPTL